MRIEPEQLGLKQQNQHKIRHKWTLEGFSTRLLGVFDTNSLVFRQCCLHPCPWNRMWVADVGNMWEYDAIWHFFLDFLQLFSILPKEENIGPISRWSSGLGAFPSWEMDGPQTSWSGATSSRSGPRHKCASSVSAGRLPLVSKICKNNGGLSEIQKLGYSNQKKHRTGSIEHWLTKYELPF